MGRRGYPAELRRRALDWVAAGKSVAGVGGLPDVIREVHAASYGSYGAKRVYAELVLGRGIEVGHNAVAMLMQRAGIAGRNGARRWRGVPGAPTAEDLVDRQFRRAQPNELW